MLDSESEPSTLFDIPEDKTVDSEITFDSCFEDPATTTSAEGQQEQEESNHPTSFLQKLSSKFQKSAAEGGADVMALRGIYGADFEGYAMVSQRRRTSKRSNLGSLLGKNNAATPKKRFLLIKGAFCFVFKDELSPAPKYAIRLACTKTRVVTASDNDDDDVASSQDIRTFTVVMETTNEEEDLEYELVFVRERYAKGFAAVANQMTLQGETDETNNNHLLQGELLRSAEMIAMETMDDQRIIEMPDNSISTGEMATYLRTPIGVY